MKTCDEQKRKGEEGKEVRGYINEEKENCEKEKNFKK